MRLLTIAIPTCNRCESLKKTLTHTLNTINQLNLTHDVAVLSIDNGSVDKTAIYMEELSVFDNFSYIKNEQNIGFDRNILKCLEESQTKYVWIIQDHTRIIPNGLINIIEQIGKGEFSFCFAPIPGDVEWILKAYAYKSQGVAYLNTMINTNIFNRDLILRYYNEFLQQIDGCWLVYRIANLVAIYESMTMAVGVIPVACSEYGAFRVGNEREKNSWSSDWVTYVRVWYFAGKIIDYMQVKYGISDIFFTKITEPRIKKYNLESLYTYLNLRLNNIQNALPREVAEQIAKNPLYNEFERILFCIIISGNEKEVKGLCESGILRDYHNLLIASQQL